MPVETRATKHSKPVSDSEGEGVYNVEGSPPKKVKVAETTRDSTPSLASGDEELTPPPSSPVHSSPPETPSAHRREQLSVVDGGSKPTEGKTPHTQASASTHANVDGALPTEPFTLGSPFMQRTPLSSHAIDTVTLSDSVTTTTEGERRAVSSEATAIAPPNAAVSALPAVPVVQPLTVEPAGLPDRTVVAPVSPAIQEVAPGVPTPVTIGSPAAAVDVVGALPAAAADVVPAAVEPETPLPATVTPVEQAAPAAQNAQPHPAALPPLAVVVPNVVLTPITTDMRPDFTDKLVTRMNSILNFEDKTNHIYGLHSVPLDTLAWGTIRRGAKRNADYLCIANTTVTVWLVAEVTYFGYLRIKNGQVEGNHRRPSLGLHLFSDGDFAKLKCAMFDNSPIKSSLNVVNAERLVYAKRWMGSSGVPFSEVPLFEECYDATKTWAGPKPECRIHPSRIERDDVVLVEVAIARQFAKVEPPRESGQPLNARTTDYSTWTPELELLRVAVLSSPPKTSTADRTAAAAFAI